MKLVHELDVPDYETMNERDPMCPALWRYRKKITIEHLSSKFQEYSQGCDQQNKCEILAEFLKKVLPHDCDIWLQSLATITVKSSKTSCRMMNKLEDH